MKRFLKDPLLHFLLLGAAIFVAYGFLSKPGNAAPDGIVITQGQIGNMATVFANAWQRPPTSEELAGLIRERVREEVYYREAMTLGLDQDDTVIRRRLRQKMEFVADDVAAQTAATEADLESYLKANPDKFRVEQRFTFQQVFLDPLKHGNNLASEVARRLARLNQSGDKTAADAQGDAFMLDATFDSASSSGIAKQFGGVFAQKLSELPTDQWQGPVESGYGVHLVRISQRTEGRVPALAEVRDAVRREWDNAQRLASNEKFYQDLLKRYKVTVEQPGPATTSLAKAP